MPSVPKRQLSYGELLDKLHNAHKQAHRRKELSSFKKREVRKQSKRSKIVRHEYSYENVLKRIKDINNEAY